MIYDVCGKLNNRDILISTFILLTKIMPIGLASPTAMPNLP